MSLHHHPIPEIPELTAQVARAAFPKGTLAIRIRDELGSVYEDEQFVDLYPQRGQTTPSPWRLNRCRKPLTASTQTCFCCNYR